MKQYTHAWIAMMAIKRLQKTALPANEKKDAASLVTWFNDHRDSVIKGSWYPDAIIKDMASSHVLKYKPGENYTSDNFKKLPANYYLYKTGKECSLYKNSYTIESGNLADRCEALAHSVVDNLKMQQSEDKGSPLSPTGNHIATIFFMLSHYIADAHMPLHCDSRQFSEGENIHADIEKKWDDKIRKCYSIDFDNERFFYDKEGYPYKAESDPLIDKIEEEIITRSFSSSYGPGNENTWDFMSSLTQYSYLTSFLMIPKEYNETNLTWEEFINLQTGHTFDDYSKYILTDAIDSVSRIWLRVWKRYTKWEKTKAV